MSQNQNKRTLRTIGLVVAVTLLTKILGIVREALQAGGRSIVTRRPTWCGCICRRMPTAC